MAFDGALPSEPLRVARLTAIDASERGFPVFAGGEISVIDRLVLMVGYAAFGLAVGAGAAFFLSGMTPLLLIALAVAPVLTAILLAVVCVRQLRIWAAPLIVGGVAAALAAPAGAFIFNDTSRMGMATGIAAALLCLVTITFCRRFIAAFSMAVLGLVLAAPIGAAAMIKVFG
jgi:hypothetical protein